jgi:mono/diheme cytochrome c family protein
MNRFVLGFIAGIVVLALVGLGFIYSGAYNVAASSPHTGLETWALNTTMRRSVQQRAADVAVPATITEAQISRGFAQFRDSCVYCHGAPGVDSTDWSMGITPEPPFLPDVVGARSPAELFWVVKNGIKMTAMPSFGKHLNDQDIWGVVGFIQRLPKLSPQELSG